MRATGLLTVAAALALTMAGCSSLKKSRSSQLPSYYLNDDGTPYTGDIKPHKVSAGERNEAKRTWDKIAADADTSSLYNRIDRDNHRFAGDPAMFKFKEIETQHVKFSYYDPFKGRDYLYYDLDAMKRDFHYPCDGWFISDYGIRSGRMHTGVDLKALPGSNVYAAFDGVVRMSKNYSSYGNVVVIRHDNGLETVYSHNSRNVARSGDRVRAGDVIAKVGRTGRATTDHVHFEVRVMGQFFNPNLLIDVKKNKLQDGSLYVYNRRGVVSASSNKRDLPDEEPVTTQPKSPTASSGNTQSGTQSKNSGSVVHRVVKGDTLYAIARRYGTTVDKIMRLNGLKSSRINIGQRLIVK